MLDARWRWDDHLTGNLSTVLPEGADHSTIDEETDGTD